MIDAELAIREKVKTGKVNMSGGVGRRKVGSKQPLIIVDCLLDCSEF